MMGLQIMCFQVQKRRANLSSFAIGELASRC
jgi:hypothetical protein